MKNEKVEIIPQSILDEHKEIERLLKDPNTFGVISIKRRRWGRTILHNLISNTVDAEVVEQKQLPPTQTPQS